MLLQGFVVGVSNPKTIVAVLPQFVTVSTGSVPTQLLVLGVTFVVLALPSDAVWALAAGSAADWFASSPRRLGGLRAGGGAMMVGLGGALSLTGNRI